MIWGHFSAGIYIDNRQLSEYNVTVTNTPTENILTCWIPSRAGENFEVRGVISAPQSSSIKAFVSVDGPGFECPPYVVFPPWTGTMEFDCLSNEMVGRKLMFKEIEFTDDESMVDPHSDDIGQIVMELRRGTFTKVKKRKPVKKRKSVRKPKDNNHDLHMGEGKVDERSKKGRHHQVSLGEETPDREEQTEYHDEWDPDYPVTYFVFNYTSLESLQADGIV